jgi:hypothetical protein
MTLFLILYENKTFLFYGFKTYTHFIAIVRVKFILLAC